MMRIFKLWPIVTCLLAAPTLRAQMLGVNHFLEIKPSGSCYIKAIEHIKLWQVTLSRFNKEGIRDTTFLTPYLLPDTVLKVMQVRLETFDEAKSLSEQDYYKENIAQVQEVLQNLQVTYKQDVLAGQLELSKKIRIEKTTLTVIPKKQWWRLKDVYAPFEAETTKTAPLGKPLYRAGSRVYYRDEFKEQPKTSRETKATAPAVKKPLTAAPVFSFRPAAARKADSIHQLRVILKEAASDGSKAYRTGDTLVLYSKARPNPAKDSIRARFRWQDTTEHVFTISKLLSDSPTTSVQLLFATLPAAGFTEKVTKNFSYINRAMGSLGFTSLVDLGEAQYEPVPEISYDSTRMVLYRKRKIIPISFVRKKGKKNLYLEKVEPKYEAMIESAEFFVKDGFIDNMAITVNDKGTKLQFTNSYPIPLSSKKNIRMLNQTYLYANISGGRSYKLCLGEVMQYHFAVEKDQYDLSPSDTLLRLEFKENKQVEIASLKKEDKNKIFEYRVFSDVIGIDETKPNGLVQIEAQRKFKLYTKYSFQRFPMGMFRYIEPSFRWNKIENQKSYLQPLAQDTFMVDSVTQSGVTRARYTASRTRIATPLDLYLYQQISVGINLNLISGYNGNTKLKYNIDAVLNFGRTKIRDSIPEVDTSYTPYKVVNSKQAPMETRINTIQWGLAFKVQFFPEARYGFIVGARYLNMYLANGDFMQKNRSYAGVLQDDKYLNRGVVSSELQVHKNFDNDSKFYIRYVFNAQANNLKYNFSQFQVGYNAFLKF